MFHDIRTFHYRIVTPNGDCHINAAFAMSKIPTYAELKGLLTPYFDGGEIEHVSILKLNGHGYQTVDMFVDETGILKGLMRNEEATAMYRAAWLARHPHCDPESLPYIAGVAVVFEERVWV